MMQASDDRGGLRAIAEHLDRESIPVDADEVMAGEPVHRPRSVPLLVAATVGLLVLMGVVVVLRSDSPGTGDVATTDRSDVHDPIGGDSRELYGAGATAIGGELWVFGGVSGPDGSSPPTTSMLPEGWGQNDIVSVYRPDGTLRSRFTLPDGESRVLDIGRVLARGDDRYLLGSLCNSDVPMSGCSSTYEPALYQFDLADGTVRRIPMSLPALGSGEMGVGYVTPLGIDDDGVLWMSQAYDTEAEIPVLATRLVGVDLSTGSGTVVPLPAGHFTSTGFCLGDGVLYATQADVEGTTVSGLRILERPASLADADWQPVTELDPNGVSGGTMVCLDIGEIALALVRYPTGQLITLSANAESQPETLDVSLEDVRIVGHVEGGQVLTGVSDEDGPAEPRILLIREAGAWRRSDTSLPRQSYPVVLDGQLRDAQPTLDSTNPPDTPLPLIDL